MSDEIDGFDQPAERLPDGQGRADSALRRLTIRGQPFYVLSQRGRFPDMAYDHGRLLAAQMEAGAFSEIVSTIDRGTALANPALARVARAIYQTYSERVLDNVSEEFQQAVEGLAEGYLSGVPAPKYTHREACDAIIAIEVGNIIDGLTRVFELPGALASRLPGLIALVLPRLADDDEAGSALSAAADQPADQRNLRQALKQMTGPNNRIDFACTGFSVPGTITRDGRQLHARNLDADLYNWNKAPLLWLADETEGHDDWHRYAAFGTAGLIFPGGISGLNDAGIAVSLHQMSTTAYDSGFLFGRGDIAPYVQQRILREAATLDQAAEIVEEERHFAAWTIFCSDAKSGETRRMEFNGDKVRIGPKVRQPVPQTNHFFDPDLMEHHFDEDDGHFTPTLGKWLETHVRLNTVTEALENNRVGGRIDLDWAIEWLAGSQDWSLEEIAKGRAETPPALASERSYGRVPRKVYGQLGSIVLADPARRAGQDQVWMTTGDRLPCPHSTYAGWSVDWQAFTLTPVAERPLRRPQRYRQSDRANWEQSLTLYVQARVAIARPRDGDGALLRRRASGAEEQANRASALGLLDQAIALAGRDRILEIPYHYMRARVRHQAGELAGAKADWDLLRDLWARQRGQPPVQATWPVAAPRNQPLMHPYEAALVLILSSATEDLLLASADWPGRTERLAEARTLLAQLKLDLFGPTLPGHFDLVEWQKLLDEIYEHGAQNLELPEPTFVTVE